MPSIDKVKINLEMMGETSFKFEDYSPKTCVVVDVITKYKTKRAWLYRVSTGNTAEVKIGENIFNLQPFKALDVIDAYNFTSKPKKEQKEIEVEDKNVT